jgi:hypothetical protein
VTHAADLFAVVGLVLLILVVLSPGHPHDGGAVRIINIKGNWQRLASNARNTTISSWISSFPVSNTGCRASVCPSPTTLQNFTIAHQCRGWGIPTVQTTCANNRITTLILGIGATTRQGSIPTELALLSDLGEYGECVLFLYA